MDKDTTKQNGVSDPEQLRIVVLDPIISRFESELKQGAGDHLWTMAAGLDPSAQSEAIEAADVLICASLTPEMAAKATRLRLVHTIGAGYDRIPLDALPAGVSVANTFHHGRPMAEHVIMVSLMLARRTLQVDREMRSGVWRTVANDMDVPFHVPFEGRTLGLLGLGTIGVEVARLAGALGMKVQAVRQNPDGAVPADLNLDWVGGVDELPRLLSTSDIVVLTIPLTEQTRGMIGAAELAAMKSSALLINVARGAIVDESALYTALVSKAIAGAALDVWWARPTDPGNPPPSSFGFAELDNVILTPHSSGHARITFERRTADIVANIRNLAAGRELFNVVHHSGQPV